MSGRSSARDGEADDFTVINGIGKVFDRRLHQAGVNSYADLAALNPEGIASRLGDAVRPGRISDEEWTGQAARLAKKAAAAMDRAAAAEAGKGRVTGDGEAAGGDGTPAPQVVSANPPEPPSADASGLHYQSFVVRILLHESDGRIASTTVQHVGSGTERRWPGLDRAAVLDFIAAFLSPEAPAPRPPGEQAAQPEDAQAMQPEEEPGMRPAHARAADDAAAAAVGNSAPPLPGSSPMSGEVSLTLARDLRVPRSREPFTVCVTLDMAAVEPPAEPRVGFSAIVLARPLSGAAPQVVCQGKGIIPAGPPVITLHSGGLPAGTYRLEAVVELIESHGRTRDLVASVEGGILVVAGLAEEPSADRQLQRLP